MATATRTRKRKRNRTKDKVIVYGFLTLIFLAGFFLGRVTSPKEVTHNIGQETAFAAELVNDTEAKPVVKEVIEPEEVIYYDCPLSEELQDYIFELCEEEDIPPALVIGLIDHESGFEPTAISSTEDYGLMQINECNHEWLSETYGVTDFLDARQNILCGVKILGNLYHKYEDPHELLMAYNMGEYGAETARENGVTSTDYSEDVLSKWYMYQVDHDLEVLRSNDAESN